MGKAAAGEPQIFEWRAKDKAGRRFWVEVNLKRAAIGGHDRLLAIVRDITDRKQAEIALQEYSERLEGMVQERTRELQDAQERLVRRQKLAMLGQLAGTVGHELRNPLAGIKNAGYFLDLVLAEQEPEPDVREMLGVIEKEAGTAERQASI